MTNQTDPKTLLMDKIKLWRNERYAAQRRWSAVHHTVLFGSIISSVLAVAIEKHDLEVVGGKREERAALKSL